MTGDSTVSIALVLSVVSLACTLIATLGGSKKRLEEEVERRASIKEEFVKVNFKLDEFCRRLDEIVKRYDKTEERLDNHEQRITNLEKKSN